MTAEQERVYELLDEIDSACRRHKVKYYLIGDELLWTVQGKNHFRCRADVCMTLQAYNSIASDLCNLPDRITEDIHRNIHLPGVYYRFTDTSGFMLELSYHKVIKECGIAVNIHIIRKESREAEELERSELIMDMGIEGTVRSISKKDKSAFSKLKAAPGFSDKMEAVLAECALKDNEISFKSSLKLPGMDPMIFPESFWGKTQDIEVYGRSYMTVKDTGKYLKIHYGDPESVIPHADTFLNRVIADADIPYSEIADDIKKELDDREYQEKRSIFYEEYFERYDKYIKERGRMDAYMRTAAERIFLWKRYYPYKDRIVRLFKDKRIDELRLVFGKMENSIKKYEAFGFLCIFDKEIWSVYIKMLKTEGYKERAKQLEKLYEDNPFKELTNEELLLQFENTGNKAYWRNIK